MVSCARSLSVCLNHPIRTALVVALVAFLGVSVADVPGAPILGDYRSVELGGSVLMGRWSEGFVNGNPDGVGNGAHAASWDGLNLGNQWELTGASLAGTTLLSGNPMADGVFIVKRDFDVTGAQLLLKSDGGTAPWWGGGGDGDYAFDLDYYFQTLTVTMAGGLVANATSTEVFEGAYGTHRLRYGHTVGIYEGAGLLLPPNYPAFEAALPGLIGGAWGTVEGTRFTIVPEPATLALVGIGLAVMGLRRRK